MTAAQRATALRVCAAIYGLGVAISLTPFWVRPAPAGQPPGFMTSLGYDASASLRFVVSLIVIPFIATLIWGPLLDRLASNETERWARNAAAIALLGALWTALQTKDVFWTALAPAVGVLAALSARRIRADFTRRDLILLPTIATVFLALLDITSMPFDHVFMIAAFLVFVVRVGIVSLPGGGLSPALCFVLSPLAVIMQTHFFARDQRHFGWPPLLFALLTPIAMRFLAPRRAERFLRAALAWVIYPIFCYAYLSAGSLFSAEGKPRSAIFEDAQHIVPAQEIMRGEHAYRDTIPPHGFVQDALLDYLLMRRGDRTLGQLLKSRGTISALNSMATYAVGVAATGSPEAGLVSFFLAVTTGGGGGTFRFLPALITLAITLQAVRRRQPRLLAWAGACAVFAFMTSLDFGLYAGLTLLFAVTRFPGRRWQALRDAAVGGAIVVVIFAIGFAVAGILSDFVRVTFREVATLGPVYALSLFDPPAGLEASRVVPEMLAYFVEQTSYLYLIWVATLIFLVVALTTRMRTISPRRRARIDTLVVLAAFVVVCGMAYAERHHLYFKTVVPALLIATVVTMLHARLPAVRLGGWAVALLVLILARPTVHLSITTMLRHSRGPIDPTVREIVDIVRARGALFSERDATMIASANRYIPLQVPPGTTFFDFTNRGLLYFLFERDCPIRQIEVAFYETEDRQREVIARIERNPNVRAALVPPSANSPDVDGVPNAVRAPLVWQYLQQHFTSDFQEGDVVFWRRVEFAQ